MNSLDSTIRLSSLTTNGPTYTRERFWFSTRKEPGWITLTFFSNQAVIPVVGVAGISKTIMGVFKLQEFVSMFA